MQSPARPILHTGLLTGLALAGSLFFAAGQPAAQTWTPADPGVFQSRIDALEAELAQLTSQVERLQFENRQLREQIKRQLEDLIFRVTELEGGDISALGEVRLGADPVDTQAAPVILSEQADLDRAKLDIQQGRFDQGEERLRDFVDRYDQSTLVPEAYYWLGQSLFTRGSFPQAANAYLAGFRSDQEGGFAADNLLQLGITLARLNQPEPACQTLREVSVRFPAADAAILDGARTEMSSLGCG